MATQEERSTRTSAALLRAARQLFARDGFDSVSVDAIAAAAGVTRGAFYHHFSGKEALFEHVFEQVETELAAHALQAAVATADPRQQLRLGCLAFIERAASSRYRRIALIDGPAVLGVARYREIDAQHFLSAIEGAVRAIRPDADHHEAELIARVLLAGVCECAIDMAARRDQHAVASVLDALTRSL